MKLVRKILLWLVVAFFIYAIIKSPSQAATIVQNAWDLVVQVAKNIGTFFQDILTRK